MLQLESLIVAPGPRAGTVKLENGKVVAVPKGWSLLPPGDAGVTRRVKAGGPTWTVKEKKGKRVYSRGVWAPAKRIKAIQQELLAERATSGYAKRRAAEAQRREKRQAEYVEEFHEAVVAFLNFHDCYKAIAMQLAEAVTLHATPVGSGTVARTQRIPVNRRAESAVIAWLRHQTTAYDHMQIPRVKGKRREIRRVFAEQSRLLLDKYRKGQSVGIDCALWEALNR